MNTAHFHLLVNHLPIVFPIAGIIVMIAGLIIKSEVVRRTAYFIFVMGAITTIAAMVSGEGAEEVAEKLNGVTKSLIHTHEEAAETFAVLSYLLGGISLIGFWASYKEKAFRKIVSYITLIFAITIMFFAQKTGTTGGEIIHTEIRTTQVNGGLRDNQPGVGND